MHKFRMERSLRPGCNQSESWFLTCDQKLCGAAVEPRMRSRNWPGCVCHIQCRRSLGSTTSTGCVSSAGKGLALSFRINTGTVYVSGISSALNARFKARLLLEADPERLCTLKSRAQSSHTTRPLRFVISYVGWASNHPRVWYIGGVLRLRTENRYHPANATLEDGSTYSPQTKHKNRAVWLCESICFEI